MTTLPIARFSASYPGHLVGCTERVSRRFIYLGRHQTISAYFSLFLVRRCYNANKLASVKVNFALSGQTARSTSSASKCPSDSRCQCPLITSQYDRTLICMLPKPGIARAQDRTPVSTKLVTPGQTIVYAIKSPRCRIAAIA